MHGHVWDQAILFEMHPKMPWWGPFCSASLSEAGLAGNVGIDCARWIRDSCLKFRGILGHVGRSFTNGKLVFWVGSLPPSNPKPRRLHLSDLCVAGVIRTAVAFHAVAWFTGCKAPREARVVVLPEYQGARGQVHFSKSSRHFQLNGIANNFRLVGFFVVDVVDWVPCRNGFRHPFERPCGPAVLAKWLYHVRQDKASASWRLG